MVPKNGYPDSVEGMGFRLDHEGCLYGMENRKRLESLEQNLGRVLWIMVAAVIAAVFNFGSALAPYVFKQP